VADENISSPTGIKKVLFELALAINQEPEQKSEIIKEFLPLLKSAINVDKKAGRLNHDKEAVINELIRNLSQTTGEQIDEEIKHSVSKEPTPVSRSSGPTHQPEGLSEDLNNQLQRAKELAYERGFNAGKRGDLTPPDLGNRNNYLINILPEQYKDRASLEIKDAIGVGFEDGQANRLRDHQEVERLLQQFEGQIEQITREYNDVADGNLSDTDFRKKHNTVRMGVLNNKAVYDSENKLDPIIGRGKEGEGSGGDFYGIRIGQKYSVVFPRFGFNLNNLSNRFYISKIYNLDISENFKPYDGKINSPAIFSGPEDRLDSPPMRKGIID